MGGNIALTPDHTILARASITYAPIGFATIFVIVCLFVTALMVTAGMVDAIGREQRTDARKVLAIIASQWRRILLFSLKFLVTFGVVAAGATILSYSLLYTVHRLDLLASTFLLLGLVLVVVGCAAWLVMPSAIRLLQAETTGLVTAKTRNQGLILAALVTGAGVALGMIAQKIESGIILDSQWEFMALSGLNSIVADAPDVLLFIALSLLATKEIQKPEIQGNSEDSILP